MKKYRNTTTGEIWTEEEILEAYHQFEHEAELTLEETMEDFEMMEWEERRAEIIQNWDGGSDDLELKLQNEYDSFFSPYHHTGEPAPIAKNKPYEQEPACIVIE